MSDTTTTDEWAISHHEDDPDAGKPPAINVSAHTRTPRSGQPKPKEEAGTPVGVGMSLMMPPEVMKVLKEIADGQAKSVAALERLGKAMESLSYAMEALNPAG